MNPKMKHAGIAGILTGLLLALEFIFFMISGYSPDRFSNAAEAIAFFQQHDILFLRIAVLFGIAGAVLRIIYVAGLAAVLHSKTPTQAVATLYFGVLGSIGHGLVALTFYVGLPMLLTLATHDPAAASNTWDSFMLVTSGFQALGNILLGLVLFGTGWAVLTRKALPIGVGYVGVLAGIATLLGVLTIGTPLAGIGYTVFIPSLILAMVFDIWVGIILLKSKANNVSLKDKN